MEENGADHLVLTNINLDDLENDDIIEEDLDVPDQVLFVTEESDEDAYSDECNFFILYFTVFSTESCNDFLLYWATKVWK